jgi:hypothetical protein
LRVSSLLSTRSLLSPLRPPRPSKPAALVSDSCHVAGFQFPSAPVSYSGGGGVGRERTISRVLYPLGGWWPSICDAGHPAPPATATRGLGEQPCHPQGSDARRGPSRGTPSYLVLLRAGFAWPAGHPAAGGLLPHHFTLTGLSLRRSRRCHFCGTFLRVTPTGDYPAPCSMEPGLSSPIPVGSEAATRPPRPEAILRLRLLFVDRPVGQGIGPPVLLPRHVAHGRVGKSVQQRQRLAVEVS